MKDYFSESKCLASLAVFRELYDSKKDVYAIISEFLNDIITSKGKHQFNITEITYLLNNTYDFNIPEAVVKTSLNRLSYLEKDKGIYTINSGLFQNKSDISKKQAIIYKSNEYIIDNLCEFISNETSSTLSDEDKIAIVHSFCKFLLEDSFVSKFSEYISAYIIRNNHDTSFTTKLNAIREGVILYSGIKYNNNLSNIGSWKSELTIFLDTEIIFHFAGYNGELFKSLFDDFFSFVKEINQKSQDKLIHLKYFREVKDEIERFFRKAEAIVTGTDKMGLKGTAMSNIVDGCTSASDIISKKTYLFQLLATSGIKEDGFQDYYHEKNHKYNISDNTVIDKVKLSTGIDDISENIKYLNYISVLRADANNSNFENIGYVLLTGNSRTLQVSWHEEIKCNGNVPLATTLDFLTNKLWFKLNKGFGNSSYPKSFNIITKALIVLSAQLNDSVSKKYDELQSKFKRGELTENQAVATIIELRKLSRKPEDINKEEVSEILESISEESIERYLHEQEHLKNKAHREAEENVKLKQDLSEMDSLLREKELMELEYIVSTLQLKQKILEEKQTLRLSLENIKQPIDKLAMKKYHTLKLSIILSILAHCCPIVFKAVPSEDLAQLLVV